MPPLMPYWMTWNWAGKPVNNGTELMLIGFGPPPITKLVVAMLGELFCRARFSVELVMLKLLTGLLLVPMVAVLLVALNVPLVRLMVLKPAPTVMPLLDIVRGYGTAFQDVGAFFGMLTFTLVATYFGRRLAFFGAFILCLLTPIFVLTTCAAAATPTGCCR